MPVQSDLPTPGKGLCLLSLDAGRTRALSQLTILGQLMHRLSYESNSLSQRRPCDIFDMIGGVGSGGFIAILLVVFGLTVKETLEEFTILSENILDRHLERQPQTTVLGIYVQDLMERRIIDGSSQLNTANYRSGGCKLVALVSYKSHAGSIFLLRNYTSRNQQTLNMTIAQALIATLATPPLFASSEGPEDAGSLGYISADWILSNPTQEIIAEAHETFGGGERVGCLLSLGCGHPRIVSTSEYIPRVEWNWVLEQMMASAESKAQILESQMGRMGFYHRFSVSSGLGPATSTTVTDFKHILAHTTIYLGDANIMQKMDTCEGSILRRNGVVPLDQLRYSGGPTVLTPRLPALTKNFVMRKKPWEFIEKILLGPRDAGDIDGPRMLFVTGIGGCGKTQLVLRFMKEYAGSFAYQFFIDGSSEDRIRADIVRNVRSLGTEHTRKEFEDCLHFLSHQRDGQSLLLYDNVDELNDINELYSLLPQGSSCLVAITSRNSPLGYLHPEGHLQLDIMSLDEAAELLLHGLNLLGPITDKIRKDIDKLAETLGCLPIALQQACAYMRQTKCSVGEYLERLSSSRDELLGRAMKIQVNMRSTSTYAAFKTSFMKLPTDSKQLLRLLSYFHWSAFPLELVKIAARYRFVDFEWTTLERDNDFYIGKRLLEEIFLHNGKWRITKLDDMIVSLENYSLVTTVHGVDTLLLQVHPLLHEWVRKSAIDGQQDYQSAAIFLLALGARNEYTPTTQYLASHVTHMAPLWEHLHVNTAIAFGSLLSHNNVHRGALRLQKRVVEELRQTLNSDDINLSNSLWDLALTHTALRHFKEAEALQEEVLTTRRKVMGERHPGTLSAASNLALTYGKSGRLKEAESLQDYVLKMSKEILGDRHPDTLTASNNLASTYYKLKRPNEAKPYFEEVLKRRKEILGKKHPHAISASSNLALSYRELGKLEEARWLQEEVLKIREHVLGERNPSTVRAKRNLDSVGAHEAFAISHTQNLQENSNISPHNSISDHRTLDLPQPPNIFQTLKAAVSLASDLTRASSAFSVRPRSSNSSSKYASSISYTANVARSNYVPSVGASPMHAFTTLYTRPSTPYTREGSPSISTSPVSRRLSGRPGLSSIPSALNPVFIPPNQPVVSYTEASKEEEQTFISTAPNPVISNSAKIANIHGVPGTSNSIASNPAPASSTSYTMGVSRSFQVLSRGTHIRLGDIPRTPKLTPSVPIAPTVRMELMPPKFSGIPDIPEDVLIALNQPVISQNEKSEDRESRGVRSVWNKILLATRRSHRKEGSSRKP